DHGGLDIIAEVLPKARQRGMKVYAWYEDVFGDIPGVQKLREMDWRGRPAGALCPLHPDYRNFLIGLTEDYCQSYEIDGMRWPSGGCCWSIPNCWRGKSFGPTVNTPFTRTSMKPPRRAEPA